MNTSCVIIFDKFTLFSLYKIIFNFSKYGKLKVRYLYVTRIGKNLLKILFKIGLLENHPTCILFKYALNDTFESNSTTFANYAGGELPRLKKIALNYVDHFFPDKKKSEKDLIVYSVLKYLSREFTVPLASLLNYADAIKMDSQYTKVVLVSSQFWLFSLFNAQKYLNKSQVLLSSKFITFDGRLYSIYRIFRIIALILIEYVVSLLVSLQSQKTNINNSNHIAIPAVWGVKKNKVNDFFWYRDAKINSSNVLYYFDRMDTKGTKNRINEAFLLGVKSYIFSIVSIPHAWHDKVFMPLVSIRKLKGDFYLLLKALLNLVSMSELERKIITEAVYVNFRARYISEQYKYLGVKGGFHSAAGSHDFHSLANEFSNGVKFGMHWSYFDEVNYHAFLGSQVYFFWGQSSLNAANQSGSICKHSIITGSYLNDFSNSNPEDIAMINGLVKRLKDQGCNKILTLFDSSHEIPTYLGFFLQWLISDPTLGILIKPKKSDILEKNFSSNNSINIDTVKKTNRLVILNRDIHPADASIGSDFTIGTNSPSAVIMSAINGHKCIYFDYQSMGKVISEKSRHNTLLHSLKERQCVFHDLEILKYEIIEHCKNPNYNPDLGDLSSIIDNIDPFRDGCASSRVGEYISWYVDGLNQKLTTDESLSRASQKYAVKWGSDMVHISK
jgi:hypothetical protein